MKRNLSSARPFAPHLGRSQRLVPVACWLLGCSLLLPSAIAQENEIRVWPNDPPGRSATDGPEADTSGPDGRQVAGKPVIRLGNVSQPMLTVFPAPADKRTGQAVVVFPGGGYHILAYDLEGTEVCEWLNSIGITGVLLKYRVPRATGDAKPLEPLQDAQRAVALVRQQAADWNIDPNQIGVLGFSAGGNLAARLCTQYRQRVYDPIDAADEVSCRPDFALLIYPAYLFDKGSEELVAQDLVVDADTPPMFVTMAQNDPVDPENALRWSLALTRAKVPVELHLYPTGGHGFGLRRTSEPVTSWPDQAAIWLSDVAATKP